MPLGVNFSFFFLSKGRHSLNHEVLHGLDQTPLDVPSTGGLDSSINQTLASSHGVKEQLLHSTKYTVSIMP